MWLKHDIVHSGIMFV